jgi:hypothetical protein
MMDEPIRSLFDSSSMISSNVISEGRSGFPGRKAFVMASMAVLSCSAFSYYRLQPGFIKNGEKSSMQLLVPPLNPESVKRVSLTLGSYQDTFVSNKVLKGTRVANRRLIRSSLNQRKEKGDSKKNKNYKYFDAHASYQYTVDDHYTDDIGPTYHSYHHKSSKKGKVPKHGKDPYKDTAKQLQVDDRYTDDMEPIIMGSDNSGSDDRYFGNENQIGPSDTKKHDNYNNDLKPTNMGSKEVHMTNDIGSDDRYFGKEDQSNRPSNTQHVNAEQNEKNPVPSTVNPSKYPISSSSKVSMNNSSSKMPSQVPNIPPTRKPNKPIPRKPTKRGDNHPKGFPSPSFSNKDTGPINKITVSITSTPTVTKSPSIPSKVEIVPAMEPTFGILSPTSEANKTDPNDKTWPTSSPTALPTPDSGANKTNAENKIWPTVNPTTLPTPTTMPTAEVLSPTKQVNNSTNNSSIGNTGETIEIGTTSTSTDPSSLESTETVSLTNGENQSPSGSSRKALFIAFASYGAGLIFAVGLISFSIIQHQRMRQSSDEEI